jgi:hypothetical protein
MIPTTIIDNFFESPELIRNYALSLDFSKQTGNFPGVRSNKINTLNEKLFNLIIKKIHHVFFNIEDEVAFDCESYFQLVDNSYDGGWFHKDSNISDIAGVIYLTPNAPLHGGTMIGKKIKDTNEEMYKIRDAFYKKEFEDINSYKNIRDEFNSCFDETLIVNNVFNRAIIYNSQEFHRENKFFGQTKEDSRLTLVFFMKFILKNSMPPMVRLYL